MHVGTLYKYHVILKGEGKSEKTHFVHVHADDLALRPDFARGEETVEAGSAAEIDDGFAGEEMGVGEGVAAAEAEVGGLRGGG